MPRFSAATETLSGRTRRRGLTMLELLVVVSIITLILLVFGFTLGLIRTGPPLEQAASALSSMAVRARQTAVSRQTHTEIVLDYRLDRAVLLNRQPHAVFAFEDPPGAREAWGGQGVVGQYGGDAAILASRQYGLLDGACCELYGNAGFSIPWLDQFDAGGDYEGVSLAFDFFPAGASRENIVSFGGVFTLNVFSNDGRGIRLSLKCGDVNVVTESKLALYRWATVEIAVSRYGVRLWIDGRASEAVSDDPNFTVASGVGSPVSFSGFDCRIDNVRFASLVSGQEFEIGPAVQLLPEGVDPQLEIDGEAEEIYRKPSQARGPVTGEPTPPPSADLPSDLPPVRHIRFDPAGKLDPAAHPGAESIHLVTTGQDGKVRRMTVTVHPSGSVTREEPERFPWEDSPERQAPEDGE